MEPYTLTRGFLRQDVIDEFLSLIWTERYYGDSEVELVVPASAKMIQKLPIGTFFSINESDEVMILETWNIEEDKLKITGISLLKWLNNRFIRTSDNHEDQYWYLNGETIGYILWAMLFYMTHPESPYLNGANPTGIPNPEQFAIPGINLKDYDKSGGPFDVGIPYGPLYDAMREIATTYEIGMQLTLEFADEDLYILGFRSYKGLNRTSAQTDNPAVRFSPLMDSFTKIKELQSMAAFKTVVYSFAPGLKPVELDPVVEGDPPIIIQLTTIPGESRLTGTQYTGFDLRALQIFASDITTDQVGTSPEAVVNILNNRAHDALTTNNFVKAVDGEIVPANQFRYGIHYNLGDIIEVQGNSGTVQTARVTEYIRSQDPAGEKAYPTVTMLVPPP